MKRLLLVGYYGYGNFGDDLLLSVVLQRLTKLNDTDITVAWHRPDDEYIKTSFPTVRLLDPREQTNRFYARFDRVLFGGGGTIFDYRPEISLPSRLRRRVGLAYRFGLARYAGTHFASVGLGIGPFSHRRNQAMALHHLVHQDFVYVRDESSLTYATEVIGERAVLGTDLSFAEYSRVRELDRVVSKGKIVIVIRHFKYGSHRNTYIDATLSAAAELKTRGKTITWVSLQEEYDAPVLERLQSCGDEVWTWNPRTMTTRQPFHELANAECILTARLHGMYLAAMLHIPCVAVNLHPKLELAATSLGESTVALSATPASCEIVDAIEQVSGNRTCRDPIDISAHESTVDRMMTHVESWILR